MKWQFYQKFWMAAVGTGLQILNELLPNVVAIPEEVQSASATVLAAFTAWLVYRVANK